MKASLAAAVTLAGGLLVGGMAHTQPDPLRLDYYTRCYAEEMHLHPWRVVYALIKDTSNTHLMARTHADISRYQALILYNFTTLKQMPDSTVRRTVVHELVHVLTSELERYASLQDPRGGRILNEQLVTRIALWDVWLKRCP